MATPNRKLIEKADLAISDLSTDGGYLVDEQADRFIRLAIKNSVLLGMITNTPMANFRSERDKIRFAGRVLQPGESATALAVAQRSKPDLSKYVLDAQLFKAEVRLNDEILEDQIERGQFANTVMELLAAAVSRDMEFVAIQGDTGSATPLLAVLDGFLVQATSNIVNASNASLSKAILRDMLKALPTEFAKVPTLQYFTNRNARIDYRDTMADRATALGDTKFEQWDRTVYQDMTVNSIPEWIETSPTQVLLTDPANLVLGIYRKIRFETDRDVSAGVNIIVCSVRFDVKIQEVTAVSKATNVATS